MATQQTTTNVVPITSASGFRKPAPVAPQYLLLQKTPEFALIAAILASLRDGTKRDRALFERINAKVRILADQSPDDPALHDARAVVTATAWSVRNGR